MRNPTLIAVTVSVLLFMAHQAHTFADKSNGGRKRILTPKEQVIADEARREIAQVLEKNLLKFFTLVAADSGDGRGGFGRQEEDDDDATLNPNTLPQVAQILGAIFSGHLNLTAIADQTFSLIPGIIRNQVDGLFKLLSNKPTTTTTASPTTLKKRRRSTKKPLDTTESLSAENNLQPVTEPSTAVPTSTQSATSKNRYRVRVSRNRTTLPPSQNALMTEDDELYRLEDEMISAAIDAEPYVRDKEPRFFIQPVQEILSNLDSGRLNLTQIIKFLPDLFQGARHAFTLLENLGQIAGVDLDEDQDDNN